MGEKTIISTILLFLLFGLQTSIFATTNMEEEIIALLEQTDSLLEENPQSALEISLKALHLSDSVQNNQLIGLSNKAVGVACVKMHLYKKSIPYLNESLKILKEYNLPRDISVINLNLGRAYRENDAYILAEKALKDCILSTTSLGDTTLLGNAYYMLAKVYRKKSDFVSGLDACLKCLEIAEQTGNMSLKAGCENEMGYVFFNQGNIDEALKYYNYALEKKLTVKDSSGIADTYISIGNVHRNNNENLIAIGFYQKAASFIPKAKYQPNVFNIPFNMGIAFYNMNQLLQSKQFFFDAIDIAKTQNSQSNAADARIWLSKVLVDEKNYSVAKSNLNEALLIAERINSLELKKNSYQGYNYYYEKKEDYEQALHYYKRFTETLNEILNNEKERTLDEMRLIYESEKQKLEINGLQNELLKQELDNAQLINSRNKWLLATFLAIAIIIIGVILVLGRRKSSRILSQKNKELRELIMELEESLQTKDKLFSIISHDLRNPFNSILGLSELMSINSNRLTAEQVKKYGTGIYSSASKAYDMLQNLLSWSRIQLGKFTVNKEYTQMSVLVEKEILNCSDMAKNKNIIIANNVDSSINVNIDVSMLSITVRNLVTNAIKFSPVNSEVDITSKVNGKHIDLIISDAGIGIPKDRVDKLFSFSTNTSTPGTEGEKGTGLGLVLCHELIKLNNGNIKVESVPGKTDFIIRLPVE